MNLKYSCFIETYNIYVNTNLDAYISRFQFNLNNKLDFLIELDENDPNIDEYYCKQSKYLTILVQDVPNALSLGDYLRKHLSSLETENTQDDYMKKEDAFSLSLLEILFQLYCPLNQLKNHFTHYDFHQENVLLYTLKKDEFITMRYVYPNKQVIEFETSFIAKIIDYGRCFFSHGKDNTQTFIKEKLETKNCNEKQVLGDDAGFNLISDEEIPLSLIDYINPRQKNSSHDLRLLYTIQDLYSTKNCYHSILLFELFENIVYERDFGTREIIHHNTEYICNVTDAYLFLRKAIKSNEYTKYKKKGTKVGTLTIYVDDDVNKIMKFD